MKRYIVECEIQGAGAMPFKELAALMNSKSHLDQFEKIDWLRSYVTADKLVCIFLAANADQLRAYGREAGLPLGTITEFVNIIEPTTEADLARALVAEPV